VWIILAVFLTAAFTTAFISGRPLIKCLASDLLVVAAAHLQASGGDDEATLRKQMLNEIAAMKSSNRLEHATSLFWPAFKEQLVLSIKHATADSRPATVTEPDQEVTVKCCGCIQKNRVRRHHLDGDAAIRCGRCNKQMVVRSH
jgi:hypothetical protein